MDNTETIEQRAKKLFPLNINDNLEDANEVHRNIWIFGVTWQKEQDEAKYKELLDSHNELLIAIENPTAYNLANPYRLQDLINKAKNI